MIQLPDAPWVRDAETNGYGYQANDYFCPVCGAENPETFYVVDNEVIGCEHCVRAVDAWEWADDHPDG